jgi:hypothetical protein
LQEKIDRLEAEIEEKERQTTELTQNYEDERQQLMEEAKGVRMQLLREDKERKDARRKELMDSQEQEMSSLRLSITNTRQSITSISKSEIDRAQEKLTKAQDERAYFKKKIDNLVD